MSRDDALKPEHRAMNDANRAFMIRMREKLGFSQTVLAHNLGLSLRAYSDIETGKSACKHAYLEAMDRILLREAAERQDLSLLTSPTMHDLKRLLPLLNGYRLEPTTGA